MNSYICNFCLPRFLAAKGVALTVRPLNMREPKRICDECKLFGETSEATFDVTDRELYTQDSVKAEMFGTRLTKLIEDHKKEN